jgi:hypothetical protein
MMHSGGATTRELLWVQPSARRRTYELRTDGEVVATLRWPKDTRAHADTANGQWTFTRRGFWHPRVTVRATGADADMAVFTARWTGTGTLDLRDGLQYHWAAANGWQSQWAWQAGDGTPFVTFTVRQGLVKVEGRVEIAPAAGALSDLAMLVSLGWYLVVLRAWDTAATAGGAVAAVVSG